MDETELLDGVILYVGLASFTKQWKCLYKSTA